MTDPQRERERSAKLSNVNGVSLREKARFVCKRLCFEFESLISRFELWSWNMQRMVDCQNQTVWLSKNNSVFLFRNDSVPDSCDSKKTLKWKRSGSNKKRRTSSDYETSLLKRRLKDGKCVKRDDGRKVHFEEDPQFELKLYRLKLHWTVSTVQHQNANSLTEQEIRSFRQWISERISKRKENSTRNAGLLLGLTPD